MKLINLTPHTVTVRTEHGEFHFHPDGPPVRVKEVSYHAPGVDGMPVRGVRPASLEGLPEPDPKTTYIVSAVARAAAEALGRHDVVSPDTGRAVRDEAGRIVAVPGFVTGSTL